MLYRSVITLVMAFTVAVSSPALQAQTAVPQAKPENVPALLAKANKAYTEKDYMGFRKALESLHRLRPNNSDYMQQLVIAYALMDEKARAYEVMLGMQQQGLSYDFKASEHTASLRGTEVFNYVNDLLIINGNPVGEVETVFTLPESVVMPETISILSLVFRVNQTALRSTEHSIADLELKEVFLNANHVA